MALLVPWIRRPKWQSRYPTTPAPYTVTPDIYRRGPCGALVDKGMLHFQGVHTTRSLRIVPLSRNDQGRGGRCHRLWEDAHRADCESVRFASSSTLHGWGYDMRLNQSGTDGTETYPTHVRGRLPVSSKTLSSSGGCK